MINPRIAVSCALLVSGALAQAQANGQQSAGEQRIQEILNGYRSDGTMALPKMSLAEVKIAVDAKFKYPIKPGQAIISPARSGNHFAAIRGSVQGLHNRQQNSDIRG